MLAIGAGPAFPEALDDVALNGTDLAATHASLELDAAPGIVADSSNSMARDLVATRGANLSFVPGKPEPQSTAFRLLPTPSIR